MRVVGEAGQGAVAQLGEHLLCKQGVVGSIPISSTRIRNQKSEDRSQHKRSTPSSSLSIARHDSIQLCASGMKCKAEGGCSLTIREGKAHSGLMRSWMRRVELYLARDARDKRRVWRVAQTRS